MILTIDFIITSDLQEFKNTIGEEKNILVDWQSQIINDTDPLLHGVILSGSSTKDYYQKISWLLEKGFQINIPGSPNLLLESSYKIDFHLTKILLAYGSDVHYIQTEGEIGYTPFFAFIDNFNEMYLPKHYAIELFHLFIQKGSVFSHTYNGVFYHVFQYISQENTDLFLPLLEEYQPTMDEQTLRSFKAFKLRKLIE